MKEQEKKPVPAEKEENGTPASRGRAALRRLRVALPYILACLLTTTVLLIAYEVAVRALFTPMYWIYYAALGLSLGGYVVYNRGFTRTRVSRNDLPSTWSEEKKDEFFADAAYRKKRSRPLLILVISLILVFVYDIVALYCGDFLSYYLPFLEFFR